MSQHRQQTANLFDTPGLRVGWADLLSSLKDGFHLPKYLLPASILLVGGSNPSGPTNFVRPARLNFHHCDVMDRCALGIAHPFHRFNYHFVKNCKYRTKSRRPNELFPLTSVYSSNPNPRWAPQPQENTQTGAHRAFCFNPRLPVKAFSDRLEHAIANLQAFQFL